MDQAQNLRELMYKKNKKRTRVITVAGGRRGIGKSSFVLNLALAFKDSGKRVLVIPVEEQGGTEENTAEPAKQDIPYAVKNKKDLGDIIEVGSQGILFLPGGRLFDLLHLDSRLLKNSFMRLEDIADIILFDAETGTSAQLLRLIRASHETILIINPEADALIDTYSIVKNMSGLKDKATLRLVLNKAQNDREAKRVISNFIQTAFKYTHTAIEELGYILRDDAVSHTDSEKTPFLLSFPNSVASANMKRLAEKYIALLERQTYNLGCEVFLDEFLGGAQ